MYADRQQRLKVERFFVLAHQLGLEFRTHLSGSRGGGFFDQLFAGAAENNAFIAQYHGFQPLGRSSDSVKYIFSGVIHGVRFEIFQYQYTTSNGKNSTTHYYSVASGVLPTILPTMSVSSEDFFDTVGKFFGGQDIQFESDEFNRAFRIQGHDEQAVHGVLHPQMMEWFLSARPPGFQVQMNRIVVYRSGVLEADFVEAGLAWILEFYGQVPDYVKQTGGSAG
jgi:hypothetical protein